MEYKFDKSGGFFAHNPATGATVYAYATSHHAVAAKRNATRTAREMIADQERLAGLPCYQEHNSLMRSRMIAA